APFWPFTHCATRAWYRAAGSIGGDPITKAADWHRLTRMMPLLGYPPRPGRMLPVGLQYQPIFKKESAAVQLNWIERFFILSPIRALLQRHWETRQLLAMGGPLTGAHVLETGCVVSASICFIVGSRLPGSTPSISIRR
ncbi:MAG: hypothetical protein WAM61_20280, partial [Desulfobacterales bacterium]